MMGFNDLSHVSQILSLFVTTQKLVMLLRAAQQQIQALERQLETQAEARLQRDAQVAELEAELAAITRNMMAKRKSYQGTVK
jgi:cell division protein FtsB